MQANVLFVAAQELGLEPFFVTVLGERYLCFYADSNVKAKNHVNEMITWRYRLRVMFGVEKNGALCGETPLVQQITGKSLHPHIGSSSCAEFCFGDNRRAISVRLRSDASVDDAMTFLIYIRTLLNSYTTGAYRQPGTGLNDLCLCAGGEHTCERCLTRCGATGRLISPIDSVLVDGVAVSSAIADTLTQCEECNRRLVARHFSNVCWTCRQGACRMCGIKLKENCEVVGCRRQTIR